VSVEVIGIDHVFLTASDMARSERFYDHVMPVLGFRKGEGIIDGAGHLFYYNRQFVYSLRPARGAPPGTTPTHRGCTISASE
jgi:glyoxylase I family protein